MNIGVLLVVILGIVGVVSLWIWRCYLVGIRAGRKVAKRLEEKFNVRS